jgi:hypothetical protein
VFKVKSKKAKVKIEPEIKKKVHLWHSFKLEWADFKPEALEARG